MSLGHNYSAVHAVSVEVIRQGHRNLLRFLDQVTWTSVPTPWEGNPDDLYNCFGYALDKQQWLEPPIRIDDDDEDDPRCKWPEVVAPGPDNQQIGVYISAARSCDFVECGTNSSWEEEFEKIVLIYGKDGKFLHASVQAGPHLWKSKLGDCSDITHPLKAVVGSGYGKNLVFMKRARRQRILP
jgi:hypothetical protein